MAAFSVLGSAARTSTTVSAASSSMLGKPMVQTKALLLMVDVTNVVATPSITPKLRARDAFGAGFVLWAAAAAITATGKYAYLLYWSTGVEVVAAGDLIEAAKRTVPDDWDFEMVHGDTDSITYSVSAQWWGFGQ